MTPPAEDRPKPRRELRAVTPDPAPDAAPWPDDEAIAPDPAAGPAPAEPGRKKRRRRRRRRGRGDADEAVAAPAPLSARARPRHWGALASFLLLVALPFAAAAGYLFVRAAPQYHSEVAFSVRSEEATSASAGLLGALTQIGSGGAPDAAILYEYIRSQEIVTAVDARLDLRAIWNRPGSGWRDGDPVFTLGNDRAIEALHRQWLRMVSVSYDTAAGIIDVTARAFAPEDAQAIAEAILAQSSALVNDLAEQAREDAVRFAREELAEAEAHLAEVRARLAAFRSEHSLVDPSADVAGQSGLLNALNAELAQALVDRDVLTSYAGDGDQRVVQADRRIDGDHRAHRGRARHSRGHRRRRHPARARRPLRGARRRPRVRQRRLHPDAGRARRRPRRGAAAVALPGAARAPDAGDDRALPAALPARRPGRPVPADRLGRADARLLQRARQPLSLAGSRHLRIGLRGRTRSSDVRRAFPQFIAAVPRAALGLPVGSLAHERDRIRDALDMLFRVLGPPPMIEFRHSRSPTARRAAARSSSTT